MSNSGLPYSLVQRAPEPPWQRSYDVTPDGEHFVMIRHESEAIPDRIQVVVNWFEELKEKVGN